MLLTFASDTSRIMHLCLFDLAFAFLFLFFFNRKFIFTREKNKGFKLPHDAES